ncbi:MAG: rod shape-determining protein [Planctomycetota bacterium]
MLFGKLLGLISLDMGVDLGTTNTLVCVKGRGIVLSEPSVVAVKKGTNQVLLNGNAVGTVAREIMAKAPDDAVAVWPLKDGVITDFEITEAMLGYFLRKAHSRKWAARPRVVFAVPCEISAVEKRAITVAAEHAGAGKVYLIEEPIAAAIGMGMDLGKEGAKMTVNIGGGTTQVAILSRQGIMVSRTLRVAGDQMDEAIRKYVRERYNLLIGEGSAEKVKIEIGSAYEPSEEMSLEIKGVDATAGLPRRVVINAAEVYEALSAPVGAIVDAIKTAVEACPPEAARELRNDGMMLCGGALLRGIDRAIMEATGIPAHIADNPMTVVARGTARILEEIDTLSQALEEGQSPA